MKSPRPKVRTNGTPSTNDHQGSECSDPIAIGTM